MLRLAFFILCDGALHSADDGSNNNSDNDNNNGSHDDCCLRRQCQFTTVAGRLMKPGSKDVYPKAKSPSLPCPSPFVLFLLTFLSVAVPTLRNAVLASMRLNSSEQTNLKASGPEPRVFETPRAARFLVKIFWKMVKNRDAPFFWWWGRR